MIKEINAAQVEMVSGGCEGANCLSLQKLFSFLSNPSSFKGLSAEKSGTIAFDWNFSVKPRIEGDVLGGNICGDDDDE